MTDYLIIVIRIKLKEEKAKTFKCRPKKYYTVIQQLSDSNYPQRDKPLFIIENEENHYVIIDDSYCEIVNW